ncbi:SDR family oxidoreductase [Bacteroides thetaiotaomicron]|nr:SDR family oxidoreductase [Bacteroides thetaiotaomicron]MCS3370633.1 SDR family oxidoreductase [Bacteroides thetaiotaomicron]
MNLEIRNKNVLIIGASKGIGREISLAFAKEGAMVTAIARNEKLLVSLQHEMKQIYEADHKYYVCDLMDMDLTVLANKLLIEKGPFDIIVHNVGGSLVSRNALGTLDEWEYAWKFNAGIAIALNNILIPPMIEKNGVVSFIFLQFRLRCYGVTRCMLRLKLF